MFSLQNIFLSFLSLSYFPSLHLSLGLHVSNPVRRQMLPNILLSDAFHLPMPARYTPVLHRWRLTSCMNHYLLYCNATSNTREELGKECREKLSDIFVII